jgi:predicted phage terminase large subunit-like protein
VNHLTDVSPEAAAAEILRRRRARDSVIGYAEYVQPGYEADPFHHLLGQKLEAVYRGEIDRLIINTPPRHGKSQLASIHFPAWFMAKLPDTNVIQASYNLDQAKRASRFTRNIIQGDMFSRVFPDVSMSPESHAADRWMLESGQEYFAVGIGTGATGKGGHLIIIDDPLKDREEADSEARRQTVWDWYQDVVYTRLERGARIIVILTRWHFDDLAGRLIKAEEQGGDKWDQLILPAICENEEGDPLGRKVGEALAPGRKTAQELMRIKRAVGERTWSALFQQKPISTEGAIFLDSWFPAAERIPGVRTRVRAWDFASTTDGDYTVGVLMSRDPQGIFYVEDVIRFRGTPLQVERKVFETAASDGRSVRIVIPQDPGQAGVAQAQSYIRRLAGYQIKAVRPTGPKETRAAGFAAQAEAGNVKLKPADWNKDFRDELAMFPLGAHDDQVDASSDAFNALLGPKKAQVLDW